MARHKRLDYPGAWQHVMQRSARGEPLFASEEECLFFLSCLEQTTVSYRLEVHAYCLMLTHYHLMLRSSGNLSNAMRHLNGIYARSVNERRMTNGPLFRDRFCNVVIMEDWHLRHLVPYIHLNPVRAGQVLRPERALYSSCRAYYGIGLSPSWLTTERILEEFGSADSLSKFTESLRNGSAQWPEEFDFEKGLKTTTSSLTGRRDVSGMIHPYFRTPEKIEQAVMESMQRSICCQNGCPVKTRRPQLKKQLLIWALNRYTDLTQQEIGERFEMSTTAISSLLHRLRKHSSSDEYYFLMMQIDLIVRGVDGTTRDKLGPGHNATG